MDGSIVLNEIYIVSIYRNIYSDDENIIVYFCMSSTEQSAWHLIDARETFVEWMNSCVSQMSYLPQLVLSIFS